MQTREFEECDIDATRVVALRPLLMENLKSPGATGSSMYCVKGESGKTLHGSEGVR